MTSNTFSIHHFDGSWLNDDDRDYNEQRLKTKQKYGSVFGAVVWTAKRVVRKLSKKKKR